MNGVAVGIVLSPLITGILIGARSMYRTLARHTRHHRRHP